MVDGEAKQELVLPPSLRTTAIHMVHDDMGHMGRDRTLSFLKEIFYWNGMNGDVEEYIKTCNRCIWSKTPCQPKSPLVSIQTTKLLELVCMDFLILENGYGKILVITDHFTKFSATRNDLAKTTADALYNHFIVPLFPVPDAFIRIKGQTSNVS